MSEVTPPAIKPEEKELSLADTSLTREQIKWFTQPVAKEMVYVREGRGGKKFKYVKTSQVKKVLNFVFGIDGWDFETGEIIREGNQIVVQGRLRIRFADGKEAVRVQFGGATIYDGVELGDAYKKACSLALTKCAAEFGFAPNIYASNEKSEISEDRTAQVAEDKPATQNQLNTINILAEKAIAQGYRETIKTPETFNEASKIISGLNTFLGGKK